LSHVVEGFLDSTTRVCVAPAVASLYEYQAPIGPNAGSTTSASSSKSEMTVAPAGHARTDPDEDVLLLALVVEELLAVVVEELLEELLLPELELLAVVVEELLAVVVEELLAVVVEELLAVDVEEELLLVVVEELLAVVLMPPAPPIPPPALLFVLFVVVVLVAGTPPCPVPELPVAPLAPAPVPVAFDPEDVSPELHPTIGGRTRLAARATIRRDVVRCIDNLRPWCENAANPLRLNSASQRGFRWAPCGVPVE
jgi:hypothetical protein